jgi:hypothetical protein
VPGQWNARWQNSQPGAALQSAARTTEETSLSLLYPLLATLAAYLIGSLSFAVLVSRFMG